MDSGFKPSSEVRADVSRRIRETMRARGWSAARLALRMRRSESSVVNLVAGGNGSPGARLRLELALGAAFYKGEHPRTLNLRALDALAAKHRLRNDATNRGRIRPRALLIARLEAHATASFHTGGLVPGEPGDALPGMVSGARPGLTPGFSPEENR